ncbi:c-type cytochrome [Sulfurimonas sp.]
MFKIILLGFSLLFFAGCQEKHHSDLDGKKLLEQKCSKCHNLDLPPKTFVDEKAPPMMAVAFHIHDFIKASSESDKIPKAIEFVKDYVVNPSASKSFCDKASLKSYGVMPSQKGKVTQDELQAIAEYMFAHYTVKNMNDAQNLQNRLNKMPAGERIALQHNCFSCHKMNKDLVGPSFKKIATRNKSDLSTIESSIKNGSSKKYKHSRGAIMPAFGKKLSDKEIKTVAKWIYESNKK